MAPASAVTPARAVVRPSAVTPVEVAELAARIRAVLPGPWLDVAACRSGVAVTGVTLRAHEVHPGDLFAGVAGSRAHGADFAAQALAAGAAALLTDPAGCRRPAVAHAEVPVLVHPDPRAVLGAAAAAIYGEPSRRLAVLGVTGTSGKTTTVYLLEAALRAAGATTGLVGTVEVQVAGQRLPSAFTTPEAPDLQALLAMMVERGVSAVPMEVSSHALAQGRVDGTGFAVGAFTNLSQDHLDFHTDMEDYFAVKALLFDGRSQGEVVCVDDAWGRRLVRPGTVTVTAAGGGPHERRALWRAVDVLPDGTGGLAFRALGPSGTDVAVRLRLPGAFNVSNALLAIACASVAGADPALAASGLAEVTVPGRMQPVDEGQPFLALVDYAHKPAAVAALLDAVRAQVQGRVLVVLGCGGQRDTAKRPVMGEAAARRADLLVVTDDNPRGEEPAAIRAAVLAGARAVPAPQRGDVVEVGDRREAIAAAVAAARPGDAVVVAGKGHETGQEIAGQVHPFSDLGELAAALRRPGRAGW